MTLQKSRKPRKPRKSRKPRKPRKPRKSRKSRNQSIEIITISADSWCGFCKMMESQKEDVKKIAKSHRAKYTFVSDQTSKSKFKKLKQKHNISSFPYHIVKKNGKVVGRATVDSNKFQEEGNDKGGGSEVIHRVKLHS